MSQLQGIEQKDIIKSVTGTITKLWESKDYHGDKGDFTIQGGEIEIDGVTYGLKFMNNTQEQSLKGKTVTLSATRSKHGLNGVSLDHESFTKKDGQKVDRDVIKVTKTGRVSVDGEVQDKPTKTAEKSHKIDQTAINSEQLLDELVLGHRYINDLVRSAYADKKYDEETIRTYVSSIFIEANRKGIKVGSQPPPAPKLDPMDWGTAVVPSGSNKGKILAAVGKPAIKKLYEHYLEKGFTSEFAKCVEQAAKDLQLDESGDPDDLANMPDQAWD
jgi:hypothetical protein